ncbi:hypothetical protein GCM10007148_26520 [Parvularcula lutaonensis]|nr:hypothetical protein GCM10007148_26520 [Parvularcula lutaonensis]
MQQAATCSVLVVTGSAHKAPLADGVDPLVIGGRSIWGPGTGQPERTGDRRAAALVRQNCAIALRPAGELRGSV